MKDIKSKDTMVGKADIDVAGNKSNLQKVKPIPHKAYKLLIK